MKFYETAKYITRHDEFPQGLAFMTNAKDFEKLSPELKKVVVDAVKGAGDYSAELMEKQAQESIARMEKKGVKYSVIDKKPFVEKIAKLVRKDGKRRENAQRPPRGNPGLSQEVRERGFIKTAENRKNILCEHISRSGENGVVKIDFQSIMEMLKQVQHDSHGGPLLCHPELVSGSRF